MSSNLAQLRSAFAVSGHARAARAELVNFRDRQLRRMVQHAYRTVPYYRALYDEHGVHPSSIRGAGDMPLLPAVTKTHFREVPERERVASGLDPEMLIPAASSGSSGRPFQIRRSWMEHNVLYLARIRALRSYGLRRTDRALNILNPKHVHARDNKILGRTLVALGFITKQKRVSIHLDPESIAAEVRAFRPAMLSGYPNMLARVSEVLEREPIAPPSIRVALTGAESLTPDLRRKIESRLGVPVRDQYGSNECNLMAWECPHGGPLHTSDDTVLVEVIGADGAPVAPGERGEVVVTSLHSFTMPLIRFRIGDLAEQGTALCDCGAPFATIRSLQGRMLDMFPLPDGRVIHPYYLSESLIMDDPDWIENFQLTQERIDHVTMRIVARAEPTTSRLEKLRSLGAELLGAGVEFDLLIVDEIPSEVSGKYRPARSLISSSYDGVLVPAMSGQFTGARS
ncbi:MAG: phenylacetate--CoA ligase family protein [Gemmatimonadaceae bacterium]|nr:phenylacetate--CoA ligase family protein [Gemmatimonadaceae bacterium]